MLDVDHLQQVNSSHGRFAGDVALAEIAGMLEKIAGSPEMLCRYNEDMFALLLQKTDAETAQSICAELCKRIEEHVFHYDQLQFRVTVSIGIVPIGGKAGSSCHELIEQAQEALESRVRAGKDE